MADEKDEGCGMCVAVSDESVTGRVVDEGPRGHKGVTAFVKEHGKDVLLYAALLGLGGYCVALRRDKTALERKLEALMSHSGALARRVRELERRCEEKDEWFKAMTAEALRRGSSFAGKCMRDRRDYLKERA